MKRIALPALVVLLVLACSACSSRASRPTGQDRPSGQDRPAAERPTPAKQAVEMSREIQAKLHLSDAFMQEVHPAVLDYSERLNDFMEDRPEPDELERERKRLAEETIDRLHPLLNWDQLGVVRQVLEDHAPEPFKDEDGPGGRPGPPPDGHRPPPRP